MEERIREFLLDNIDVAKEVIDEINCWNSSLEHLQFFSMDYDFNEFFHGESPIRIAELIFYGSFNPNHPYWNFNGDGNLNSFSSWEMEEEIKCYICDVVDSIIELANNIDLPTEILEMLEEEEDEEE